MRSCLMFSGWLVMACESLEICIDAPGVHGITVGCGVLHYVAINCWLHEFDSFSVFRRASPRHAAHDVA